MQRTPAGLPSGMPVMGELIDGAMQQAPQPGRQFMSCAALSSGGGLQAGGGPQNLVHHGAHAVAVGGLDEGATVVKRTARSAQGEGLGHEPAFQVGEQGAQVAL